MILTKFKTHLGQNTRVNDTEFSTLSLFFFLIALETHQSASRSVLRVYYAESILLGPGKEVFFFLTANTWALPQGALCLCDGL